MKSPIDKYTNLESNWQLTWNPVDKYLGVPLKIWNPVDKITINLPSFGFLKSHPPVMRIPNLCLFCFDNLFTLQLNFRHPLDRVCRLDFYFGPILNTCNIQGVSERIPVDKTTANLLRSYRNPWDIGTNIVPIWYQ